MSSENISFLRKQVDMYFKKMVAMPSTATHMRLVQIWVNKTQNRPETSRDVANVFYVAWPCIH